MKTTKKSKHITRDIRAPATNSPVAVELAKWLKKNPALLALARGCFMTDNGVTRGASA